MVVTGLERVVREPELLADAGRLGLLYNQASVDSRFRSAPDVVSEAFAGRMAALFGPQHGVGGTEQDNMIETDHAIHPRLGLPIFSLYADSRKPGPGMLDGLDTVLVDLQDVGTRVYTFATTALHLMEAAAAAGIRVVVLDRPNPLGGLQVEGNVLDPHFASFVGPHPIPMRHGLTLGELLGLYNEVHSVGCRLTVVPMEGWGPSSHFDETSLPWVMPSPNLPLVESAVVYPGQVILEGTNFSEGRGTTRPFEMCGAPYMEPDRVLATIEPAALDGVVLREVSFRPTFNKWAGSACLGFHVHVTDRRRFLPYRFSLALVSALLRLYPDRFRWTDPPYEYVYDRLPIDVILGDASVRTGLEAGRSVLDMEREWQPALEAYRRLSSDFFLYPR